MAEYNKGRYYWIKLTDRFIESDTVDYLMSQKDGANYVVLYQMLCLKTVNNNGELARQLGEILIPYDVEKIARDCKFFSVDTVRIALELYKNLGLIYMQENGILKIADFERLIGSQTESAEKKQIQRNNHRQKLLNNGNGQTSGQEVDICPPDIDIYKDKEKEYINTHAEFEILFGNFCKKWQITVDNYSPLLAELDFDKLDKAYEKSKKFLQVTPCARTISWVLKNIASIYAGKYEDKPKQQPKKEDKLSVEEIAEKVGIPLDKVELARKNGWTGIQIEKYLREQAIIKGVEL